jgi:hypothetical protein
MAHASAARAVSSALPRHVLFVRVGSMTYYAGPQSGDERPKGGGGYNKKNVGHELFNFSDFGGRLFVFFRAKNNRINLARIAPTARAADSLDDVLVVFVARQHIIGWYGSATVHKRRTRFPATVAKQVADRINQTGMKGFTLKGYCFEGSKNNATLLPTRERKYPIPGNVKGGFGQSNVCYPYRSNGKLKASRWMEDAISYVLNYDKENLLKNPNAENESDEVAAISQEQGAGFLSNPAIRREIEEFAMIKARSALRAKGYRNFKNTATLHPYDYTCERVHKTFFVEVKGTQTTGKTVILTRGEVNHVNNNNKGDCILVLVHSVLVSGTKNPRVSGGVTEVRESWTLRHEDLSPIQYMWTVS